MSIPDKHEEHKLALMRASMTLAEWVDDVKDEVSPEWLASQTADTNDLVELLAKNYLIEGIFEFENSREINHIFDVIIADEAKRRMLLAKDDYEEQYGRRP